MRDIKYRCNFCCEIMQTGYGINWTGGGGGNKINFVTDANALRLENHLCKRCADQITSETLSKSDKGPMKFNCAE